MTAQPTPNKCETMKSGTSGGAIPANVLVRFRATVIAGLAKLVDDVNQFIPAGSRRSASLYGTQREKTAPWGLPEPVQPCGHLRPAKLKPGCPSSSRKAVSMESAPVAGSSLSR